MDMNPTRPAPELASLTASALQTTRFKERRTREVHSDVRNEAVFYSPVIKIDSETQNVVLQYRDSETGKIEREYPKEVQVGAYETTQHNTDIIPVISNEGDVPFAKVDEDV